MHDTNRCNYPEFALKAANAVAKGEREKGILCYGTGVGISIAANKVKRTRCVVCSEPAKMIVESWLSATMREDGIKRVSIKFRALSKRVKLNFENPALCKFFSK